MSRTQIRGVQVVDGTLTDADIAAANKDGAAGTPCMRTLGTGAQQAAAGNDARFVTNGNSHDHEGGDGAQIPTNGIADGAITGSKVAAANKDGAAGTASMRTLGTGAQQAAAGNDARFVTNGNSHDHEGGDGAAIPAGGIGAGAVTTNKVAIADAVHVHRESIQSINNNSWTLVQFDNERYDTNSMHDNSTNNTRLTAKKAGLYIAVAQIGFGTSSWSGQFGLYIMKNSATIVGESVGAPVGYGMYTLTIVVNLAVNDYLELAVYQNSGGALNLGHTNEYCPEFSLAWLGRIA